MHNTSHVKTSHPIPHQPTPPYTYPTSTTSITSTNNHNHNYPRNRPHFPAFTKTRGKLRRNGMPVPKGVQPCGQAKYRNRAMSDPNICDEKPTGPRFATTRVRSPISLPSPTPDSGPILPQRLSRASNLVLLIFSLVSRSNRQPFIYPRSLIMPQLAKLPSSQKRNEQARNRDEVISMA